MPDSSFYAFPKLGSSRELSRAMDARKVDISVVSPERWPEFPYRIQNKTSCTIIPFPKLLKEVRENNKNGIPVIFYQQTKKALTRFVVQDEFAILYMQDFIDMMFKIANMTFELKQKEHFDV
jgi:hypothetical protein